MASIISAAGGEPRYPELLGLDKERLGRAAHIVLLVVDGLGFEFLKTSTTGTGLRRHLQGSMSSVFPPTTATAIPAYLTGLAPRQHGLTGWFTYFKELGTVATVLPFTTRLGSVPLGSLGVSATALLGHEPVFDALDRACYSVAPARIADSEFNRSHLGKAKLLRYESMREFFGAISAVIRKAPAQSFTYAYWPELDHLCHSNGVGSKEAAEHLAELDAGFDELLHGLRKTDTLLLVTADHGFVDIAPERIIHVDEYPELRELLRVPLCGEPRTAYCYVAAARSREFLDFAASELSEYALCVDSRSLIDEGYFGPPPNHPQLADRVGDFTLLLREGYAIQQRLPGEEKPRLIGMHGGLSTAELEVPLIVAEA